MLDIYVLAEDSPLDRNMSSKIPHILIIKNPLVMVDKFFLSLEQK